MKFRKLATAPVRGLKSLGAMVFGRSHGLVWRFLPRTRFDYAREVGDGMGSSLIMAPILWMARAFPEAPLEVLDADAQPVEAHPMVQKLRRPNPFYSGAVMWMAVLVSWVLDGNAYLIKVRNKAGTGIAELWYAPHWSIEPVSDHDDVFIEYYRYSAGGQTLELDPSEVVHFRYGLDPRDPRKGLSPLGTVLREVFTDDEAANFAAALLHNTGVPGVLVSPEKGADAPSGDDVAATKDYIHDNFRGDDRGKPLVMSGPTKVQQFGFSPEQMQVRDLRRVPEERVTAAIGLPAVVVGLGAGLERSTFANFAEAREAAYEQNMVPTWRLFAEDLWVQLLPDFDDDAERREVTFATREVRALQEDRNKEAERVRGLYKDGVITRAQAKRDIGLEAEPADEVYLQRISETLVPVGQLPGEDPQDPDEKQRLRLKALKQAEHTGAMVALYPPAAVAQALALTDLHAQALALTDLHLTLAYLGEASEIADEQALLAIVGGFAHTCPPLDGIVSGTGQFTAGDAPVTYASADVPGLPAQRERLVEALSLGGITPASEHGFTPHITLAYADLAPEIDNLPLRFERVTVTLAGERYSFPLAGDPPKRAGTPAHTKDRARDALTEAFERDAGQLTAVLAQEVELDLDALGRKAAEEFEQFVSEHQVDLSAKGAQMRWRPAAAKADSDYSIDDSGLAAQVTGHLALDDWKAGTLTHRLEVHYARTAQQTLDTINTVIDLGTDLPDPVARAIVAAGGTRAGLVDISEDTKQAIFRALHEARSAGEGPIEAARRIRQYVPAGRFVNAGANYRAELIARTETLNAQRLSALAAYKQADSVTAVIASDARLGDTDAECVSRDGVEYSFEEAEVEAAGTHPNCTLSFSPVVGVPVAA